ncbi:rhsD domain protein [Burkholderia pseudomallei TSV44]|nr:rhsD domain protein [Burkholderia pseudomallei TSV44]
MPGGYLSTTATVGMTTAYGGSTMRGGTTVSSTTALSMIPRVMKPASLIPWGTRRSCNQTNVACRSPGSMRSVV